MTVSLAGDGRTVRIRSDTCSYQLDVWFNPDDCADSRLRFQVGPEYKPSGDDRMEGMCQDCNDVRDDHQLCFTYEDVSDNDDKFMLISDSCVEGEHQHQD